MKAITRGILLNVEEQLGVIEAALAPQSPERVAQHRERIAQIRIAIEVVRCG